MPASRRALCVVGVLGAVGMLGMLGAPVGAQAVVSGIVREDSTNRPIAGVEVNINGARSAVRTDSTGRFTALVPKGTRDVVYRMLGYRELRERIRVSGVDTTQIETWLVRQPAQLDPIVVSRNAPHARGISREAFDERRRLGIGKFVDSVEMRKWDNRGMPEMLRERMGIRVIAFEETFRDTRLRGPRELRAASARTYRPGGAACWAAVILDGSILYSPSRNAGRPPDFSRDVDVPSLESAEFYEGAAEIPLQFGMSGGDGECGLLVLWSKRS